MQQTVGENIRCEEKHEEEEVIAHHFEGVPWSVKVVSLWERIHAPPPLLPSPLLPGFLKRLAHRKMGGEG